MKSWQQRVTEKKKRKKNLPDKMSIQWWKWQNKSPMTLHDHNNNDDDDDDDLIWMTTMKIQKKNQPKIQIDNQEIKIGSINRSSIYRWWWRW